MRRKKVHCAIFSPSLEPAIPYVILSSQRLQLRDKPPPRAARAESERLREALSRKAPVIGFRSAPERCTSAPRVLCGCSACPPTSSSDHVIRGGSYGGCRTTVLRLPPAGPRPPSFPLSSGSCPGLCSLPGRGSCQGRSHDNMGEGRADFGCRKASSFTSRT